MGLKEEISVPDLICEGVEYYDEKISGYDRWDLFYHLSSLRRAALVWYPFGKDSRVLEAGCGFGALTGVLCEKAGSVDAVEIDPLKAEMTRKRYARRTNLRVISNDLRSFSPEGLYDCVVAVEFLEEYRGDITKLLQRLGSFLAPGGTLLLGFRNRYGLKYQCGAVDEYVKSPGGAMEENAPLHSKTEMSERLKSAGLEEIKWYYPLPDFGFTQAVCSDDWLPEADLGGRILTYDPFGNGSPVCAAREYARYGEVIRTGRLPDVSDVYLAECRAHSENGQGLRTGAVPETAAGAVLCADREREHAFSTVIYGDRKVIKTALYPEGISALHESCRNARALAEAGIRTVPQQIWKNAPDQAELPFVKDIPLADHIRFLLKDRKDAVVWLFEQLYADICRSSEPSGNCRPELDTGSGGPVLKKAYIDMIPNNAFLEGDDIVYYDQEFTVTDCPAKYVLYRALRYTWLHIREAEKFLPLSEMKRHFGLEGSWAAFTRYEDAFTERNRNRKLYAQLYRWAWGSKPYGTGLVMGTFDLFHKGHLNLIRRAKERCRYLRAGVLCDSLVMKYKKIRTVIPEEERCEIVEAIREVDEVVLITGDYVSRVKEWYERPFDCFFSGDDYIGNEAWKKEMEELKELGATIEFFPYTDSVSSTAIRNSLKEQ